MLALVTRSEPSAARARRARRVARCARSLLARSGGGGRGDRQRPGPDPVVARFPIAYVKRPVPMDDGDWSTDDVRAAHASMPDADLFVRDRASPVRRRAQRHRPHHRHGAPGDIRDVEPSFDGTKLVFAMRGHFDRGRRRGRPADLEHLGIRRADEQLRRVIASDTIAEEGHDVAPHYLPDGRIVFSSTRQRQSQRDPARRGQAAVRGAGRGPRARPPSCCT